MRATVSVSFHLGDEPVNIRKLLLADDYHVLTLESALHQINLFGEPARLRAVFTEALALLPEPEVIASPTEGA